MKQGVKILIPREKTMLCVKAMQPAAPLASPLALRIDAELVPLSTNTRGLRLINYPDAH
uniref:Uncharacterized protein n=1 Tax=Arundo donax TaxID=35708 RepID=A0A0A9DIY4_ARUDO